MMTTLFLKKVNKDFFTNTQLDVPDNYNERFFYMDLVELKNCLTCDVGGIDEQNSRIHHHFNKYILDVLAFYHKSTS